MANGDTLQGEVTRLLANLAPPLSLHRFHTTTQALESLLIERGREPLILEALREVWEKKQLWEESQSEEEAPETIELTGDFGELLGQLRLWASEPSPEHFEEIMAALEEWENTEEGNMALDYLRPHLRHWPAEHCKLEKMSLVEYRERRHNALGRDLTLRFNHQEWGEFQESFKNSASPMQAVQILDLSPCRLGPMGAQVLRDLEAIEGLESLNLSGNNLGKIGAMTLACSSHFKHLRWLDLSENDLGDTGLEALCSSQYLAGLKHLSLRENKLSSTRLENFASGPFQDLASLDLSGNQIGIAGARLLAEARQPWAHLDLCRTLITAEGLRILLLGESFKQLESLRLLEGSGVGLQRLIELLVEFPTESFPPQLQSIELWPYGSPVTTHYAHHTAQSLDKLMTSESLPLALKRDFLRQYLRPRDSDLVTQVRLHEILAQWREEELLHLPEELDALLVSGSR